MFFALVYQLLRRAVWLVTRSPRELMDTEVELVVLRHQLKVLKRQVARPRLRRRDRVFLAAVSRAVPNSVVIVPGQPPDPPPVAPGAGAAEVDLRSAIGWRPASDHG